MGGPPEDDFDQDEIRRQLSEYSKFVENVLKPQLAAAVAAANLVRGEVAEYEALGVRLDLLLRPVGAPKLHSCVDDDDDGSSKEKQHQQQQRQQQHPKPVVESMVDLGYGAVFCRAVVRDPTKIFVHVGMGFHVEMTMEGAREFVSQRTSFLKGSKLKEKEAKEKAVRDHLSTASIILNQLQTELRRSRR
jgi:prefoldin subunit 5